MERRTLSVPRILASWIIFPANVFIVKGPHLNARGRSDTLCP